MERERFKNTEVYYVVGILCLSISLGLFALSFYILPNLAFGWHYKLPSFVPVWSSVLQEAYQLSEKAAAWFIFLGMFLPALVLVVVADILSNRVEAKRYHLEEKTIASTTRRRSRDVESNFLIVKILVIIVLVFTAAQFFQWIISSSPKTIV